MDKPREGYYMNKLIGLVLILTLAACSKSPQNQETPANSEVVTVLDAKNMTITGDLNLGLFQSTDSSKLVTYTLKNSGTESLSGPASLSGSDFVLAYQNCNSVAIKGSCTIKVSFDPKRKSGPYYSTLTLSGLTAQVQAYVSPPVAVDPSVQFLVSGVDSGVGIDFGSLTDKQSVLKTITIKNTGTVTIPAQPVSLSSNISPNPFTLSYDACSGKDLLKGASCQIKVTLSGIGRSGLTASSMSFSNLTISLSGQVQSSSSSSGTGNSGSGSVSLGFLNGTTALGSGYDFGTITSSESKLLVLTIKNSGTLIFSGGVVSSSSADFIVLTNSCDNKSLTSGSTCQLRVSFSGSGKLNNSYSGSISLGGVSLSLAGTVFTRVPVITYAPQYSDYGACKVGSVAISACDGSGDQLRSVSSCRKLSDGVDSGSATLGNCNAYQNDSYLKQPCLSPSGDKTISISNGDKIVNCPAGSSVETFISISCDRSYTSTGFHNENNNSCISNIRVCSPMPETVRDGNQVYNDSSSSWGSCQINACTSNYDLVQGVCVTHRTGGGSQIVIRPKDISIPMGTKDIRFYVSQGTNGVSNYSLSLQNIPGAVITLEETKNVLGDIIKVYTVSFENVTNQTEGVVVASDGFSATASSVSVSNSIFGLGGVAATIRIDSQINSDLNQKQLGIDSIGNLAIPRAYNNNVQSIGYIKVDSKGVFQDGNSINIGSGSGEAVVDSNGNTYVSGYQCTSPCSRTLNSNPSVSYQDGNVIISKFLPNGNLDTSFGNNGILTLADDGENHSTKAYNSSVTNFRILNNRLVATANSYKYTTAGEQGNRPMVYVYLLNGQPDLSFNGSGSKEFDLNPSTINQFSTMPPASEIRDQYAKGISVDSNGNYILIAASPTNKREFTILYTPVLIKFNSTGSLVSSFGSNGVVNDFLTDNTVTSTTESYYSTYSENDNEILIRYVLGTRFDIGFNVHYKKYLKSNGSVVSSFADFDSRELVIAQGVISATYSTYKMVLLPDGGVVYAFNLYEYGGLTLSPGLFKVNASGLPDTTWNNGSAMVLMKGLKSRTISRLSVHNNQIYVELTTGNMGGVSRLYSPTAVTGSSSYEKYSYAANYGIVKIDGSNASNSSLKQRENDFPKVAMVCGPYGDFNLNTDACVCDSGYQTIDNSSGDSFGFENIGLACVKASNDLCPSDRAWNGSTCALTSSCNNNLICESWNGENSMNCSNDCSCSGKDFNNCTMNSGGMCNWFYPMIDCPSWASDSMSCTQANASCSWTPSYQDCGMNFNNNEFGCNGQSGCMWMPNDMMDPMAGGTCSGQYQDYNSGPGACSGQYQDQSGINGYCY